MLTRRAIPSQISVSPERRAGDGFGRRAHLSSPIGAWATLS